MYISSKMMGKPRGRGPRNYDYNNAHRNVFISSASKECRASLLRWIPGKKFHPEYVTQAATPMWPIFDLRRFDTSAAAASHTNSAAACRSSLCGGGLL